MDRWTNKTPARRRVRRLFTDPAGFVVRAAGWLRERRQREREREGVRGGGAAGWLEPPQPNQMMFCDWSEFDRGRGWWWVGGGGVCLPPEPFPWPISSSPSHGCASFIRDQPVASCQLPGMLATTKASPPTGHSSAVLPCRGSRSHAIGRSLLRSGLQEDYSTLRDSM